MVKTPFKTLVKKYFFLAENYREYLQPTKVP